MFRFTLLTLCAGLPVLTGCLNFAHPTPVYRPEEWRPADELPNESKSCVYVFLFNGPDPLGYCNVAGIRDHLNQIGFGKTYFGQALHLSYFAEKIRFIAANCPEARFVIIGYDTGACEARTLACKAKQAGINLDLLLFLEPRGISSVAAELATHTITIRGTDCGWLGAGNDYAGDVVRLEGVHKLCVPSHADTLNILERELTLIGMAVSFPPRNDPPKKPLIEPFPAPRETKPKPKDLPAQWLYLRPGSTSGFVYNEEPAKPELLPMMPRIVAEPKKEKSELPAPRLVDESKKEKGK